MDGASGALGRTRCRDEHLQPAGPAVGGQHNLGTRHDQVSRAPRVLLRSGGLAPKAVGRPRAPPAATCGHEGHTEALGAVPRPGLRGLGMERESPPSCLVGASPGRHRRVLRCPRHAPLAPEPPSGTSPAASGPLKPPHISALFPGPGLHILPLPGAWRGVRKAPAAWPAPSAPTAAALQTCSGPGGGCSLLPLEGLRSALQGAGGLPLPGNGEPSRICIESSYSLAGVSAGTPEVPKP